MKVNLNVGFISLGCSKNLIDTEATIGIFKKNNFSIVNEESKADILVINTCGFIESAKEEAINTILEMAEYKKQRCKYLIVMGCLVQRYYEDLIKLLPEVDLFIKIDEYDILWKKIEDLIKRDFVEKSKNKSTNRILDIEQMPLLKQEEFLDRVITTGKNYAYLKIGEGCSNKCTYCAIPYIRGPFISRRKEDCRIVDLIEEISKIEKIKWIRFLYSYPEGITEELINVVKNNPKVAKYFDVPIQHISDKILKRMNRKTSKQEIEELIKNIRNKILNVTLRTSLIVGFPGETKEDFEELIEFIKKAKFDKLGTFMYSKEEGTPAEKLPEQIHGNTKKARYKRVMGIQQEISKNNLKNKLNKEYEVLIEDITFDGKYYIGRTMQDVPEIDGMVYIKNSNKIQDNIINNFKRCKIIEISNYDLIAEFVL